MEALRFASIQDCGAGLGISLRLLIGDIRSWFESCGCIARREFNALAPARRTDSHYYQALVMVAIEKSSIPTV
jgi:hypothetical protein